MDARNLLSIHERFGEHKLKNYKTLSFLEYFVIYPFIKRIKTIRLLNYMPYNKKEAVRELEELIGYKPYAQKHGESQFTKFFQSYFLPVKFGYDKRIPHLSTLVMSGQMSRHEALEVLEQTSHTEKEINEDIEYFCKKLRITRDDFEHYLQSQNRSHDEFPNWNSRYKTLLFLRKFLRKIIPSKYQFFLNTSH